MIMNRERVVGFRSVLLVLGVVLLPAFGFSQGGAIVGTISDDQSNETLIGCSVQLQGTTKGTITDLDGKYQLSDIAPGNYNLVFSYISYDQQIVKAVVEKGKTTTIDIRMKSATVELEAVTVAAKRRTDTDMAMISSIKSNDLIVSGISSQQIARSQDKDAAEVMRRVPGVTITDGRFIIVRGLVQRYNAVLINGSPAPSFETDKRAFSFDAMPSSLIDNILIYKSPAPELPADFAGATINIITRNTAEKNSLKIGYSAGYNSETTFREYYTYEGGKTDWLGYDDGTRQLPSEVPSTERMRELNRWPNLQTALLRGDSLVAISESFRNIWSPKSADAFLNQGMSIVSERRFRLGSVTAGNITSIYWELKNETHRNVRKAEYNFDDAANTTIANYDYTDTKYHQKSL